MRGVTGAFTRLAFSIGVFVGPLKPPARMVTKSSPMVGRLVGDEPSIDRKVRPTQSWAFR